VRAKRRLPAVLAGDSHLMAADEVGTSAALEAIRWVGSSIPR
jgi:hypothetical protein